MALCSKSSSPLGENFLHRPAFELRKEPGRRRGSRGSEPRVQPGCIAMDVRGTCKISGYLLLVGVVVGVASGCGVFEQRTPQLRGAGAHIGPVGPVALLEQTPREKSSRPRGTAVHLGGGPSQRPAVVPDSKIRLDVGMKLEAASLDLSDVTVEVEDQRVTLSGSIPTLRGRDRAELIARSVRGVGEVDNELSVEAVRGSAEDL